MSKTKELTLRCWIKAKRGSVLLEHATAEQQEATSTKTLQTFGRVKYGE